MIDNTGEFENPNYPDYFSTSAGVITAVTNSGTGVPLTSTLGSVVSVKTLTTDPLNPTVQLTDNGTEIQVDAIQTMQDTYDQSVLQGELAPMVSINQNQPVDVRPATVDGFGVGSELFTVKNSSGENEFTVRRTNGSGQTTFTNMTVAGFEKLNYNVNMLGFPSDGQNNVTIGRASQDQNQTGNIVISTPMVNHLTGADLPDPQLIVTSTYPNDYQNQSVQNSNAVINMNNVVIGWFDNNVVNGSYVAPQRRMAKFTGDTLLTDQPNLGNSPLNCRNGAFNATTGNNLCYYFGGRATVVGPISQTTQIPMFSSSIGSNADINLTLNTNCFHFYSGECNVACLQYDPATPANHSYYKLRATLTKSVIPGGVVTNNRLIFNIISVFNPLNGDSTLPANCPTILLIGSSSLIIRNNNNPASVHGGANGVFVYWFYNQYQTCRYDPATNV